ncbi:dUTP diphosphatase [Sporosarcina sp. Marseille-Q4063]|uniref:dUTP diphosphatase n=1 Tax=Sporosarcina sp. Marseille-Q4063 TaxID=2810514 RepID=UPI001BB034F9|nr:dUTP diphosphatase [Sporosarcina sp. Marseille-Q4063]QUW22665.1 dUTP diphosphatase [Sporosarcina sp. Marseille-Q4063]
MKLTKLFEMQTELDAFIQKQRTTNEDVFQAKGLALLVELAELANETRSFKFWSSKGPSEIEVILEEYVDSIHFILSLGIELGFETMTNWPEGKVEGELTELFLKTTESITYFLKDLTMESYANVWIHYGSIAEKLEFSHDAIIEAYILKNEENYTRQKVGY